METAFVSILERGIFRSLLHTMVSSLLSEMSLASLHEASKISPKSSLQDKNERDHNVPVDYTI